MNSQQENLRARLFNLGFDEVRFASLAEPLPDGLRPWLAAGMQADMAWIDRTAEKRMDPRQVLHGAKSIIMLGVNYWAGHEASGTGATWARYSLYQDYHDTMRPGL